MFLLMLLILRQILTMLPKHALLLELKTHPTMPSSNHLEKQHHPVLLQGEVVCFGFRLLVSHCGNTKQVNYFSYAMNLAED